MTRTNSLQNMLHTPPSQLPLRILVGSSSTGWPIYDEVNVIHREDENVQSSPRLQADIVENRQATHPKAKPSAAPKVTRVLTFFMLPGEIRNQIYREVSVDGKRITLDRKDVLKRTSLLRTCRQIRSEASSIWYAENKFLVPLSADDYELLPSWLELMGKENQQHLISLHKTFDIAYVFSKARIAAVDWPAKHDRYLAAITRSHHAAVHAEDIEECTDDWNEIQTIWLNLAATLLEHKLWEWHPVIDWDIVRKFQVKCGKMENWQHYRDSAKSIYMNELQLKIQQLKTSDIKGAKTYKSWLEVCEKYGGYGEEEES